MKPVFMVKRGRTVGCRDRHRILVGQIRQRKNCEVCAITPNFSHQVVVSESPLVSSQWSVSIVSVFCPLSSVCCPLSSVLCPLSSVLCRPSSECIFTVFSPNSFLRYCKLPTVLIGGRESAPCEPRLRGIEAMRSMRVRCCPLWTAAMVAGVAAMVFAQSARSDPPARGTSETGGEAKEPAKAPDLPTGTLDTADWLKFSTSPL